MQTDRRRWCDDEGRWHLDVRGHSPPQPFVEIVAQLEERERRDGAAACFVAHLDRDPVMLYPELAERGWTAERVEGDDDEVRLLLRRAG